LPNAAKTLALMLCFMAQCAGMHRAITNKLTSVHPQNRRLDLPAQQRIAHGHQRQKQQAGEPWARKAVWSIRRAPVS
jgi:hypothetical protein